MLDSSFGVWLLEVNCSPTVRGVCAHIMSFGCCRNPPPTPPILFFFSSMIRIVGLQGKQAQRRALCSCSCSASPDAGPECPCARAVRALNASDQPPRQTALGRHRSSDGGPACAPGEDGASTRRRRPRMGPGARTRPLRPRRLQCDRSVPAAARRRRHGRLRVHPARCTGRRAGATAAGIHEQRVPHRWPRRAAAAVGTVGGSGSAGGMARPQLLLPSGACGVRSSPDAHARTFPLIFQAWAPLLPPRRRAVMETEEAGASRG